MGLLVEGQWKTPLPFNEPEGQSSIPHREYKGRLLEILHINWPHVQYQKSYEGKVSPKEEGVKAARRKRGQTGEGGSG